MIDESFQSHFYHFLWQAQSWNSNSRKSKITNGWWRRCNTCQRKLFPYHWCLCREFTSCPWILLKLASNAVPWCCLYCSSVEVLIWDAIAKFCGFITTKLAISQAFQPKAAQFSNENHYSDVIISSMASLAFVWGIHRWPGNSPHKGLITRKMSPFDDVTMGCAVIGWKSCGGYDYIMPWKRFLRYWPFVRGIHRSPVNSLTQGR